MPSIDEVLDVRRELYEKSVALVEKKGHDYNRTQQANGDTLFNLRVCETMGIVSSAETGVLVRLSDKFMRLASLVAGQGAEPAVSDESIEDTVLDIHNYIDYLIVLRRERAGFASRLAERSMMDIQAQLRQAEAERMGDLANTAGTPQRPLGT